MHKPYLLINAFGGNLRTLAKRLMGLSPSFFLFSNRELTKKLIILARHELKIELGTYEIKTNQWGKHCKQHTYDKKFYQYKDRDMEKLDDLLCSVEYDTLVDGYIAELHDQIYHWCYDDDQYQSNRSIASRDSKRSTKSKYSAKS